MTGSLLPPDVSRTAHDRAPLAPARSPQGPRTLGGAVLAALLVPLLLLAVAAPAAAAAAAAGAAVGRYAARGPAALGRSVVGRPGGA